VDLECGTRHFAGRRIYFAVDKNTTLIVQLD